MKTWRASLLVGAALFAALATASPVLDQTSAAGAAPDKRPVNESKFAGARLHQMPGDGVDFKATILSGRAFEALYDTRTHQAIQRLEK